MIDFEVPTNQSFGLWQLLNRTQHLISKARQKELKKNNIELSTAGVLFTILVLGERSTPAAIARQTALESHTVSERLERMQNEGLISKRRDLKRKNQIRVEVTDKGYEVFRKSAERESIKDIMSALTQAEQRQLWVLLAKLRAKTLEHLGVGTMDIYPPSDPPKE